MNFKMVNQRAVSLPIDRGYPIVVDVVVSEVRETPNPPMHVTRSSPHEAEERLFVRHARYARSQYPAGTHSRSCQMGDSADCLQPGSRMNVATANHFKISQDCSIRDLIAPAGVPVPQT